VEISLTDGTGNVMAENGSLKKYWITGFYFLSFPFITGIQYPSVQEI